MPKKTQSSPSRKSRRSKSRAASSPKNWWSRGWPKLLLVAVVMGSAGLIYLDAWVRGTLDERRWQAPAQVYARPLTLYPGLSLAPNDLRRELGLLGYRNNPSVLRPGEAHVSGQRAVIYVRPFNFVDGKRPEQRWTLQFRGDQLVDIRDDRGRPLELARLEPLSLGGIFTRHREDRTLVQLEDVPPLLIETLLLVEDRDFRDHWGLSFRGIARAAWANLRAGRTVQGGSTLTQQLVKNVFLSNQRSLVRKGLEALMAPLVELHYSKDKILESYINEVYLGQEGPRAIHGFALASRHYFNQPLSELSPAQIALLVGMIKGPSLYDPWLAPERATERRNLVLALMNEHGMLPAAVAQTSSQAGLGLAKPDAVASMYPAYLDLVRRQLRRDYRDEDLQTQGLKIFTAFDPLVQSQAERSMSRVLGLLDPSRKLEAAVVVTDAVSGDVVAIVGGRRMRFAGFNRALDAVRPVGSLAKPIVYLSALMRPEHYTLVSLLADTEVTVKGADGSLWQPQNYDKQSHGEVPLHWALAQSYNLATARLGMEVGLDRVLETAEALGVQRDWPAVPALTLGAVPLSPLEVASVYQTLAAHGVASQPRAIRAITTADDQPLARYPQQPRQVVPAAAVHLLHYALQEVVREGTGRGIYQTLPTDYRVAGKTGTTDDLRDSWFAGFTGDYLAVVWLGRDDNKPAGLTGSAGALRVWSDLMAGISRVPMPFAEPDGIEYHWVDPKGRLSAEMCEGARYIPFIKGSAPTVEGGCRPTPRRVWRWFRGLFE